MTSKKVTINQNIPAMLLATLLALSMLAMTIQKTNAQPTLDVGISSFAFVPQNLLVYQGDAVVWNNTDPVIHTLWFVRISDGSTYLLSDPINPGATWARTFSDKVNLQYFSFGRLWVSGLLNVVTVGDVNGDGIVDIFDLVAVAISFGQTVPPAPPNVDVNHDGIIDIFDLVAVALHFGQ